MKRYIGILILMCGISSCVGLKTPEEYFRTRGIILDVNDLGTYDWPRKAKEAGITTIAGHIFPGQVAEFIASNRGRQFLAECAEYGIQVEYELHAMADLLPRELFAQDSTMFRMDEKGRRVADWNLCVHSEKAMDIVCKNAVKYARILTPTTGRYFYWLDDGVPMCKCPLCREYSDSDLALMIENRIVKALKAEVDPNATLAHLAYYSTLEPPTKVKPGEGIFLEFAPFQRTWEKPIADPLAQRSDSPVSHGQYLKALEENLKVFPAETAQVLEYWLDVSLFSGWKKPAVRLPWNREAFLSDIDTYAGFGIRNISTFGVYMDSTYFETWPDDSYVEEYGQGLKEYSVAVIPSQKNPEIDGSIEKGEWSESLKITDFVSPWHKIETPEIKCYLCSDGADLCFAFDVSDKSIVTLPAGDEHNVASGDRVEIFLSADKDMGEYYCIEIDPHGNVLDYRASFYRSFDEGWDAQGLTVAASVSDDGYRIEGKLPLGQLNLQGEGFYMGVYGADFNTPQDEDSAVWSTWIDPLQDEPDFHVPTSLRRVHIE